MEALPQLIDVDIDVDVDVDFDAGAGSEGLFVDPGLTICAVWLQC